jgi:hypothetical protein
VYIPLDKPLDKYLENYLENYKNMIQRSPYSLFHYKTLEKRMMSFGFPKNLSDRLQKISKWVTYIQSENQPNPVTDAEFLHDLCIDVLGYRSPFAANSKIYELEFTPSPALGFFGDEANYVVVEIFIGDITSKPQLNYPTTEWMIVTDYRYMRLYARRSVFFEQFNLEDIVNSPENLRHFYFMLCRRTLLPANSLAASLAANSHDQSRLSKLLTESEEIVQESINSFYNLYHKIRVQLIKDFSYRLQLISSSGKSQDLDPNLDRASINLMAIAKAQKLLNRIIFIAYCQDHKLLPSQLILNAYQFYNPYIDQPIWENYKAIFRWVSNGNSPQSVFGYGSSLFEFDLILDELLFVGDELCRQIKELSRFDFSQDLSGMAIAYILKELNKDLDLLKSQSVIKRKKLKYPSKLWQSYESITRIIKSHLDSHLDSHLGQEATVKINDWTIRKATLENLKIYDPECRSGIFLVMAFNILLGEYQQIYDRLKLDWDHNIGIKILQTQIYGCDRSFESVEITKLNLWLNTVTLNQTLVNIEENIQLGDITKCDFQEVINLAQTTGNLRTISH